MRPVVWALVYLAATAGLGGCDPVSTPSAEPVPAAESAPAAEAPPGFVPSDPPAVPYPWIEHYDPAQSLVARIPAPPGMARVPAAPGTFGDWLRHLPLKPGRPPVRLYNGRATGGPPVHVAVVDLDVGPRDLQQCADAVIRLRAEYLFARGLEDAIAFNFTSGDRCDWTGWAAGRRPIVRNDRVQWARGAPPDRSYDNFRLYLDVVFQYAGTTSLSRELSGGADPATVRIGDVFIRGGHPGHAAIVVDVAADDAGQRAMLLAQSFMPAQDLHVLANPARGAGDPWYRADFGAALRTPTWTFRAEELKRFGPEEATGDWPSPGKTATIRP